MLDNGFHFVLSLVLPRGETLISVVILTRAWLCGEWFDRVSVARDPSSVVS